jgi:hypothetical protein
VGNSSISSYTNTGLSPATTYYYQVSAYNSAGESGQSSSASATTWTASGQVPGTLAITVGFNLGAIAITGGDGDNIIRKNGSPPSLTLSAQGYSNVVWYVDGGTTGISNDTLTIHASNYTVQRHSVTFTGTKDGIPYSQAIPFTVVVD